LPKKSSNISNEHNLPVEPSCHPDCGEWATAKNASLRRWDHLLCCFLGSIAAAVGLCAVAAVAAAAVAAAVGLRAAVAAAGVRAVAGWKRSGMALRCCFEKGAAATTAQPGTARLHERAVLRAICVSGRAHRLKMRTCVSCTLYIYMLAKTAWLGSFCVCLLADLWGLSQ